MFSCPIHSHIPYSGKVKQKLAGNQKSQNQNRTDAQPEDHCFSAEKAYTDVETSTRRQRRPPSTWTRAPVVNRDISDARNAMVWATSSGWPTPPRGCIFPSASRNWKTMLWLLEFKILWKAWFLSSDWCEKREMKINIADWKDEEAGHEEGREGMTHYC